MNCVLNRLWVKKTLWHPLFYCMLEIFFFILIRMIWVVQLCMFIFFSPFILEILEQARRIARVCWRGILTNFSLTFCLKRGNLTFYNEFYLAQWFVHQTLDWGVWVWVWTLNNSIHPNISMHKLHTVLYTFPRVLNGRICIKINSFFCWLSFPLFLWP